MAKVFKFALSATSKLITRSSNSANLLTLQSEAGNSVKQCFSKLGGNLTSSRAHSTLSVSAQRLFQTSNVHTKGCHCAACSRKNVASYSTDVDKEIVKFLDKEIQYESSRASEALPKIAGFDIKTDGGDVTLTRTTGVEKLIIRLSVNGAVDSIGPETTSPDNKDEPPQMVCRPPFEVELSKGDGTILALQCTFPSGEHMFEEGQNFSRSEEEEHIDDQFEIQEVAIHGGEWKDSTYSVSAATMDAELFDLLMDMLDERGINDEFINQLVDYCTAYENKEYIRFLRDLKTFADK